MAKEEVYVSIEQPQYKKSKADILSSQATLLQTLKHIHNLRVYTRRKNDLKNHLQETLQALLTQLDLIQAKMPTPKIPKLRKKKESKVVVKKIGQIDSPPVIERRDEVEAELKMIQEKLKRLNG